ncbi:UPF0149 family protein [Castellaniella sp.]|uniref:UPF0149 family protein n=1 Tax=Castellaniella sp. TaxID=1955812 RepID=UPI002AFEE7C1|nr:UPF0149 family protein [Castellaniella sp.]
MQLPQRLSDRDLDRLDDFLSSDSVSDLSMDVATLEGWLTALAIGPRMVMPSDWLPWVWDFEHGQEDADFASIEQANEIIGLIMGWWNQIVQTFQDHPETFEPVFRRQAVWGAAEWCEGFLKATQLFDADAWSLLWAADAIKITDDNHALITPFLRLGDEAGVEITRKNGDAQKWVDAVVPTVLAINEFWAPRRTQLTGNHAQRTMRRTVQKVGRNDPCPCGSGKKYKHCCGRPATLH